MEISPYIAAGLIAWIVAQGSKYIVVSIKSKTFRKLRQLYMSGNMPSAHSATVVALLTVVALRDGTGSAIFAVTATFAAIVMYDAVMVRRSSGEQGAALLKLLKDPVPAFRVAKGHTPVEVLVGALLGAVVGAVVFLATQ